MAVRMSENTAQPKRVRWQLSPNVARDNIAGWAFITPALALIFIYGLFPIAYAVYMSLHDWRIRRGAFLCERNFEGDITGVGDFFRYIGGCLSAYTDNIVGDWWGFGLFALGFVVLLGAYLLLGTVASGS